MKGEAMDPSGLERLLAAVGDLATRVIVRDLDNLSQESLEELQRLVRVMKSEAAVQVSPRTRAPQDAIGELYLTVRTYNTLRENGIDRISELRALEEAQLFALRGIGGKAVQEIERALERHDRPPAVYPDGPVTLSDMGTPEPPDPRVGTPRMAFERQAQWMRAALARLSESHDHPFSWTQAVHAANNAATAEIVRRAQAAASTDAGLDRLELPPRLRRALIRRGIGALADLDAATADLEAAPYVPGVGSGPTKSWRTIRAALDAAIDQRLADA